MIDPQRGERRQHAPQTELAFSVGVNPLCLTQSRREPPGPWRAIPDGGDVLHVNGAAGSAKASDPSPLGQFGGYRQLTREPSGVHAVNDDVPLQQGLNHRVSGGIDLVGENENSHQMAAGESGQ